MNKIKSNITNTNNIGNIDKIKTNKTKQLNLDELDLDINNYSLDDLFRLFNIEGELNELELKNAKKTTLLTHPDKSGLDSKYFLFYSSVYKKLYGIYEFQNKSTKNKSNLNYNVEDEHGKILNKLFKSNEILKKPEEFNKWFNENFEKYNMNDDSKTEGYGEWLKTDEGVINVSNVSQTNMNEEFEKQKKIIQSLSIYNGTTDNCSSSFGCSILNKTEHYSSGLFINTGIGYTDIKQAYTETLIPVTDEDYNNMQKFKNVQEYNMYRDNQNITPLDEKTALKQLSLEQQNMEQDSAMLAYKLANELEKNKVKHNKFWASLNQITI